MSAVWAGCCAQWGMKPQWPCVTNGFVRGVLNVLFEGELGASPQHPDFDRQVSQPLQSRVVITAIRHGGQYTRPRGSMQAMLHRVSEIARFYTVAGRRIVFSSVCHSGRKSSATATPHTHVVSLVRRFHITSSGRARSKSSIRNANGDRTVSPGAH